MSDYLNVKECADQWDDFHGLRGESSLPIGPYYIHLKVGDLIAKIPGKTIDEARANARLIAEAGTVAHESGRGPREMWERLKGLAEAVESHVRFLDTALAMKPDTVLGNATREAAIQTRNRVSELAADAIEGGGR